MKEKIEDLIKKIFAVSPSIESFALSPAFSYPRKINNQRIPSRVGAGWATILEEDKTWLIEMNLTTEEVKEVVSLMNRLRDSGCNCQPTYYRKDFI